MKPHPRPLAYRFGALALAVAALIVPERLREAWLEEWRSEVWHSLAQVRPKNRITTLGRAGVLIQILWGFVDAARLRMGTWRRLFPVAPLHGLGNDFRFAFRALRHQPGLSLAIAVTLSLAMAGTASVFAIVDGVLLDPLPYEAADRLVAISASRGTDPQKQNLSYRNFLEWNAPEEVIEAVGAYRFWRPSLTQGGPPERLNAWRVTAGLLDVLAVEPALGRRFDLHEDRSGSGAVALLTHDFWQRRFGADPTVVGRPIRLDGDPHIVVGVLAAGFAFPPPTTYGTVVLPTATDVLVPLGPFAAAQDRSIRAQLGIGRLRPDVSLERAQTAFDAIAERLERDHPGANRGYGLRVKSLHDAVVAEARPALTALLAAALMIDLLAICNVGSLLLTRALARRRENAVRTALGAGRGRIARQVLVESQLLAALGCLGGIVLGTLAVAALRTASPASLPRADAISLELRVTGFVLGLSVLGGLAYGLVVAADAGRVRVMQILRGASGGTGDNVDAIRSGLVAVQIAVSVVLLVGAGLVGRSFVRLSSVDAGFDPRQLLTARLELPAGAYPSDGSVSTFFTLVTNRVRALPSVKAVGLTSALPTNPGTGLRVQVPDVPETLADIHRVRQTAVSPDYFATLGVRVLAGRSFAPQDDLAARPVAIVSETFARQYFPGREAVGRQLLFGSWRHFPATGTRTPDIAHEVIGVVSDIRNFGGVSEDPAEAIVYVPHAQDPWRMMSLVLRAEGEPGAVTGALRAAIADVDSTQPLDDVTTMQQLLGATRQEERFNLALLAGFALVATSLATIGVYSMLSHAVAQRRRELAIRRALGADGASIMRLVLRRAGSATAAGLVTGAIVAFLGSRLLAGLLFETSPTDALTFASAGAAVGLVSLLAGYLPARRAADTDVAGCVRQE